MTLPISFLSDYGAADEFAGVCRAVIARIAPDAKVLDLTHGIPRHDVARGAAVLEAALPYTPPGVHLAVVDPGVGTSRRAVALRLGESERVLVGPDNGLLTPAAARLGGVVEAVEISGSDARLQPVSATFHGRDVFAPVAARLALGDALTEHGPALDPADLLVLQRGAARVERGVRVEAEVIGVDGFGNVSLSAVPDDATEAGLRLGAPLTVRAGGESAAAVYANAFGDAEPGALLLFADSTGVLALAVNRGNAATRLGLRAGDPVELFAG